MRVHIFSLNDIYIHLQTHTHTWCNPKINLKELVLSLRPLHKTTYFDAVARLKKSQTHTQTLYACIQFRF